MTVCFNCVRFASTSSDAVPGPLRLVCNCGAESGLNARDGDPKIGVFPKRGVPRSVEFRESDADSASFLPLGDWVRDGVAETSPSRTCRGICCCHAPVDASEVCLVFLDPGVPSFIPLASSSCRRNILLWFATCSSQSGMSLRSALICSCSCCRHARSCGVADELHDGARSAIYMLRIVSLENCVGS